MRSPRLVGEHPLQSGLIGRFGHHALVQFLFTLVRLRRQDMTAKGMTANHFARTGFLEPLGRTFMGLQLWHKVVSWGIAAVQAKRQPLSG